MQNLPVGVSNLAKIIQDGYCYVDKTYHIANLVNRGSGYFFLSRPRRFGKSLLVDTLKQAFMGRRELFEDLYLQDHWDWSVEHPVIHLSFSEGTVHDRASLDQKIHECLDTHYEYYQCRTRYDYVSGRFSDLISQLAQQRDQRVVVLVDEYDKPILDNITDIERATQLREGLKNLYSVIKGQDANLQFVLLTGVSKFSKVSLFSGLNNLEDITLDPQYADLCGYTQAELEYTFADYLQAGDVDLEHLKLWYNGYNFAGSAEQTVYNPFDILLFFRRGYAYHPYWFETATPSFLIRLMEHNQYFVPELEKTIVSSKMLSSFDVDHIPVETLLFQTGYLTIKDTMTMGQQFGYELSYPNLEVKLSLNEYLAGIGAETPSSTNRHIFQLGQALQSNELHKLETIFKSLFASIPHDWYKKHDMHRYEGFYASIVYSYLVAVGYELIPEDTTNQGQIDLTMKLSDKILIFEFKLARLGTAAQAIEQIKQRQYPQQYEAEALPIHLVGISFDETDKNVADFVVESF